MRRRIVEVKPESRRFRPEAVQTDDRKLRASIGEVALAKQIQRVESGQPRKRAAQ